MPKLIQYYVEGECEEKLIRAFQHVDKRGFKPGKIEILNPANQIISSLRINQLKKGTTVALVYDTDHININVLKSNVESLKRSKNIDEIYHVQSIENFEDEIVYASSITSINEIFNTKSTNEFKKKFIAHKELVKKLEDIDFSVELIWSRYSLNQDIKTFSNSGKKIKK
ncbi:MAG: hypothetical protein SO176_00280 [Bacilli bacterium]|nr:hypothetical protein [Bacilli bacterium]